MGLARGWRNERRGEIPPRLGQQHRAGPCVSEPCVARLPRGHGRVTHSVQPGELCDVPRVQHAWLPREVLWKARDARSTWNWFQ